MSFDSLTHTLTHMLTNTHGYQAWLKWKCLMLTNITTSENSSGETSFLAAQRLWRGETFVGGGGMKVGVRQEGHKQ